jgi:hypothetical protein
MTDFFTLSQLPLVDWWALKACQLQWYPHTWPPFYGSIRRT